MFNEELIAAKVAARNAGKILIKHLESHSQDIQYKKESGNSPVTAADHEADQYLSDFLGGEFPHDGWLSEETVDTFERLDKKRVWIIDQLDGKKEFIKKLPEFCVSIALVENQLPVVGVIYNPVSDEMFYAHKNKGAFLNGNQIKISSVENIKHASIVVSRSERTKGLWCIINESGGVMKKINGDNILYNQKKTLVTDPIIATNSMLFDSISDLLY